MVGIINTTVSLLLLMVQKSGEHQLIRVEYLNFSPGFIWNPWWMRIFWTINIIPLSFGFYNLIYKSAASVNWSYFHRVPIFILGVGFRYSIYIYIHIILYDSYTYVYIQNYPGKSQRALYNQNGLLEKTAILVIYNQQFQGTILSSF